MLGREDMECDYNRSVCCCATTAMDISGHAGPENSSPETPSFYPMRLVNLLPHYSNIIWSYTVLAHEMLRKLSICLCLTNRMKNKIIKTANKQSKKVGKLKYLRMSLQKQNCRHKQIKRRLSSGYVFCHFDPNLSTSCLLTKKAKRLQQASNGTILPIVSCR